MYPCHLQEQPDAVHARRMPSNPNAEGAADDVFARVTIRKPTATTVSYTHLLVLMTRSSILPSFSLALL